MNADFQRISTDLNNGLEKLAKKCFKTRKKMSTIYFCTTELGKFLKDYYKDEKEMSTLGETHSEEMRIEETPAIQGVQYHIRNPKLAIYETNNTVVIYAFLGYFGEYTNEKIIGKGLYGSSKNIMKL